ncbi:alpha/beta hydrolase [Limnohabitans sp. 2KL-27]|uniref:alpha/beta hydrolase n=1 Tax=Limnohabitans sp. 2KL-27 TaxID=1100705 RepID=UPI000A678B28|nr:alpha/beta hydrolase [Limnohabitans sp. 2KL-27]
MPTQDAAWYDRMYNNRALVPDFADHFEHWKNASAQARDTLQPQLDVPYGDGPNETLDIFPAAKANAPVVVFIHGGYWRSLDKSDHSFVAPALRDMGACVVVVNYALCPGTPDQPITIPDIALQMARATAWVWRHIGAHGGDRGNITAIGHSAGGHLAAMLLACDWKKLGRDLPAGLVRKSLSISGLFDLAPVRKTPFVQADLRITPAHVRMASPAKWQRPSKGVLYTVVGGDESPEFLRHNRLIHQAWGPKTVPICEDLPGLNHFSVVTELTRSGSRLNVMANTLVHQKPA